MGVIGAGDIFGGKYPGWQMAGVGDIRVALIWVGVGRVAVVRVGTTLGGRCLVPACQKTRDGHLENYIK